VAEREGFEPSVPFVETLRAEPVTYFQLPQRTKVKWHSPYHRFVIALHSPDGVVETGLFISPSEKKPAKRSDGDAQTLSPVQFERNNSEIAPISGKFQSNPGGFLCISNCLVALPGIEPGFED
jgi:hypothetical protein